MIPVLRLLDDLLLLQLMQVKVQSRVGIACGTMLPRTCMCIIGLTHRSLSLTGQGPQEHNLRHEAVAEGRDVKRKRPHSMMRGPKGEARGVCNPMFGFTFT
jgi:hypothetical protein